MRALVDAFAVSETYFFRNPEQWQRILATKSSGGAAAAVSNSPNSSSRFLNRRVLSGS